MASDYSGDDDDAWDFDLLDDILRKAEAANAAKRASQAALMVYPSSGPLQPESLGTSNFTSQVSYSTSGLVGPDSEYRAGEGAAQMGRGWQHSNTPARTTVETVRSTGYHVTQPAGPRSGMGSPQQNLPDRVAGAFVSPQPSTVGNVQNRANQSYGNFTNALSPRYTGYENMPPPGPSPLGRQPFSQAPSGGAMLNLSSSEADEEKRKLRDELAEKTGAVSLLKSRLSQADKEIFELKTRTGRQSNGQSGVDQARELNRLSSELLFKDQELLEARRSKASKDEQLKEALASAAALKEELEALRSDRRNVVDDEHKQVLEREGSGNKKDSSTARELSGDEQEEDAMVDGEIPRSGKVLSEPVTRHPPSLPSQHMFTSPNEVKGSGAKMQKPGGEAVKGKEKVDLDSQEGVRSKALDVEIKRLMDLKHSLEHIWGLKGPKEDGVTVIPKLYAACSKEVHTLLNATLREQEGKQRKDARPVVNPGGNRKRKGDEVQGPAEREDSPSLLLHNAISKVASRLASPSALIGPLLRFCNMTNVELVFCALHTLQHLLIQDSSSRDVVMGRKGVANLSSEQEMEPASSGSSDPLKPHTTIGKRGWCITRTYPMAADGSETEAFPVFSSPRIVCRRKGVGAASSEKEPSTAEQVPKQVDLVLQEGTTGYDAPKMRSSLGEGEIFSKKNSFASWLLDVASKTASTDVQGEAAAIVHLLVAHSEPRVERIKFAFMLLDGSLAGLLRQAASPETKMCAVKIVTLLLSSSDIYRRFCMSESGDQAQDLEVGGKSDLEGAEDMQVDGGGADENVEGGISRKPVAEAGSRKDDGVMDVLTALSSCLIYTGNSGKEYALRRRAVRAFTFLLDSGELGAATLIRRPPASGPSDAEKQDGAGATEPRKPGGDAANPGSDSLRSKRPAGKDAAGGPRGSSSVALQLMTLIDSELDADEEEEGDPALSKLDSATERMKLVSEAVSLLCRLSAHEATSFSFLSSLTSRKQAVRLSVSVTNRLIRKVFAPQVYRSSELTDQYAHIAEQAEGLKKRILSSLPPPEEPQPSEKMTSLGNSTQ